MKLFQDDGSDHCQDMCTGSFAVNQRTKDPSNKICKEVSCEEHNNCQMSMKVNTSIPCISLQVTQKLFDRMSSGFPWPSGT